MDNKRLELATKLSNSVSIVTTANGLEFKLKSAPSWFTELMRDVQEHLLYEFLNNFIVRFIKEAADEMVECEGDWDVARNELKADYTTVELLDWTKERVSEVNSEIRADECDIEAAMQRAQLKEKQEVFDYMLDFFTNLIENGDV